MRKALLAFACLLPFAAHAVTGDDFARQNGAKLLVDTMNSVLPFDTDLKDEKNFLLAKFSSTTPCAEQTLPEISKLLGPIYTYETLKPHIIDMYAANFTFHELNDLNSFFRAPSGQKWLRTQPQMRLNMRQVVGKLVQEKQPEMTAIIAKQVGPDGKCKVVQGAL